MIRRKPSSIGASQRLSAQAKDSAQAIGYRRKPKIRRKPSSIGASQRLSAQAIEYRAVQLDIENRK
jgi:hypothetical protein